MMKTTMHLYRPVVAPAASRGGLSARRVRPSIVRLGIVLSVTAALVTVPLEAILDVPILVILVPVVIVGFVLSWHACGRPLRGGPVDRSGDDATTHRRG